MGMSQPAKGAILAPWASCQEVSGVRSSDMDSPLLQCLERGRKRPEPVGQLVMGACTLACPKAGHKKPVLARKPGSAVKKTPEPPLKTS